MRMVEGGNLVRLPELIDRFGQAVESDLSAFELLEYIPLALRLGDPGRIGFFTFDEEDSRAWELTGDLPATYFLPQMTPIRAKIQVDPICTAGRAAFRCVPDPGI